MSIDPNYEPRERDDEYDEWRDNQLTALPHELDTVDPEPNYY